MARFTGFAATADPRGLSLGWAKAGEEDYLLDKLTNIGHPIGALAKAGGLTHGLWLLQQFARAGCYSSRTM